MWNMIKTGILVTIVACIIWVFAEAESLRSAEVRGVELTFQPEPGSKYIIDLAQDSAAVHGNTIRADVIIDGPAAALDVVERALRRTIIVSPGMEGVSTDLGRHP